MKPKHPKSRFKAGQVVMIRGMEAAYPVKLKKWAFFDLAAHDQAWYDTFYQFRHESQLRPLTATEKGE